MSSGVRGTLTLVVDVGSIQKLTALRDYCQGCIEDEGVTVIAANSGIDARPFTVFGSVKGRPEESWRQVYLAENSGEARELALKDDPKRTVVAVLAGDVPAA